MPANLVLMSGLGEGGPFRPADTCPVASKWAGGQYMSHQGDDGGTFLVADAQTRDGAAAVRLAIWRCVHCGALLAGIGRADCDPDAAQEFTWLEEKVALIGVAKKGHDVSGWTEPNSSFTAEVVAGPGSGPAWGPLVLGEVVDHEQVMNAHAAQVTVDVSGVGGFQAFLHGSLDGDNFFVLAGPITSNGLLVVENMPARYVRAAIDAFSGSSPGSELTVTILVVAQED